MRNPKTRTLRTPAWNSDGKGEILHIRLSDCVAAGLMKNQSRKNRVAESGHASDFNPNLIELEVQDELPL